MISSILILIANLSWNQDIIVNWGGGGSYDIQNTLATA